MSWRCVVRVAFGCDRRDGGRDWRNGQRDLVNGPTVEQAFTNAGFGGGSMAAIDFYAHGDDHKYVWNASTREWDKISATDKKE